MDVGGQVEWEANIAQILSRTKQNLANLQRYPQVTSPVPQPYPPPPPAPPYYNNNGVNNNNNYSYTLGLLSTSREPAGMNRRTSSVQQNPAVCLSPDYNNGNNNNFPPPQLSIKTQQQPRFQYTCAPWGEDELGMAPTRTTPTHVSSSSSSSSHPNHTREPSSDLVRAPAPPIRAVQNLQQQVDSLGADLTKAMTELVSATRLLRTQQAQIDTLQSELVAKTSGMTRLEAWKGEEDAWRARVDSVLTSLTNDVRGFEKRFMMQQDALTQRVTVMDLRQGLNAVELGFATVVDTALAPVQMHQKREIEAMKKQITAQKDATEALRIEMDSLPTTLTPEAAKAMVNKSVTEAENRVAKTVGGLVDDRIQEQMRSHKEAVERAIASAAPTVSPVHPGSDKIDAHLRDLEGRVNRLEGQAHELEEALATEANEADQQVQDVEARLQAELLGVIGGVSEDFRHEYAEVQERLGVVEAKLGIEPPKRLSMEEVEGIEALYDNGEEGLTVVEEGQEGEEQGSPQLSRSPPQSPQQSSPRSIKSSPRSVKSATMTRTPAASGQGGAVQPVAWSVEQQEAVKSLRDQTERVEGRMDEMREEFTALMEEVQSSDDRQAQTLTSAMQEVEALRTSLEALKAKYDALDGLPQQVLKIEDAQAEVERTIQDIKNNLESSSASNEEHMRSQQEKEATTNIPDTIVHDIELLKSKVARYEGLEEQLETTDKQVEERLTHLQEQINTTQAAVRHDIEEKLVDMEGRIGGQIQEATKGMEAAISKGVEERLVQMEANMTRPMEARLEEMDDKISSVKTIVSERVSESQAETRSQMEGMIGGVDFRISSLVNEMDCLSQFVQGVNQAVGGARQVATSAKDEVRELSVHLEEARQGVHGHEAALERLKDRVDSMDNNLQHLEKTVEYCQVTARAAIFTSPKAPSPQPSSLSALPPQDLSQEEDRLEGSVEFDDDDGDLYQHSDDRRDMVTSPVEKAQEEEHVELESRHQPRRLGEDLLPPTADPEEEDERDEDEDRSCEDLENTSSESDTAEERRPSPYHDENEEELKEAALDEGNSEQSHASDNLEADESEEIDDYSDQDIGENKTSVNEVQTNGHTKVDPPTSGWQQEQRGEDDDAYGFGGHGYGRDLDVGRRVQQESSDSYDLRHEEDHQEGSKDKGKSDEQQHSRHSSMAKEHHQWLKEAEDEELEVEQLSQHSNSFDEDDELPMMGLEEQQEDGSSKGKPGQASNDTIQKAHDVSDHEDLSEPEEVQGGQDDQSHGERSSHHSSAGHGTSHHRSDSSSSDEVQTNDKVDSPTSGWKGEHGGEDNDAYDFGSHGYGRDLDVGRRVQQESTDSYDLRHEEDHSIGSKDKGKSDEQQHSRHSSSAKEHHQWLKEAEDEELEVEQLSQHSNSFDEDDELPMMGLEEQQEDGSSKDKPGQASDNTIQKAHDVSDHEDLSEPEEVQGGQDDQSHGERSSHSNASRHRSDSSSSDEVQTNDHDKVDSPTSGWQGEHGGEDNDAYDFGSHGYGRDLDVGRRVQQESSDSYDLRHEEDHQEGSKDKGKSDEQQYSRHDSMAKEHHQWLKEAEDEELEVEQLSQHSDSFDEDDELPMMGLEEQQEDGSPKDKPGQASEKRENDDKIQKAHDVSDHEDLSEPEEVQGGQDDQSHGERRSHHSNAGHGTSHKRYDTSELPSGMAALDYDDVSLPPESDEEVEPARKADSSDGDISIDSAEYRIAAPGPSSATAAREVRQETEGQDGEQSTEAARGRRNSRERILRFSMEEAMSLMDKGHESDHDSMDIPTLPDEEVEEGQTQTSVPQVAEPTRARDRSRSGRDKGSKGQENDWDSWDNDDDGGPVDAAGATSSGRPQPLEQEEEDREQEPSREQQQSDADIDPDTRFDMLAHNGEDDSEQQKEGEGQEEYDLAGQMQLEHRKAEEAFDGMDQDGDGFIPATQLDTLLRELKLILPAEEIQSIIMRLADHRRLISREHFLDWYVSFLFDAEDPEDYYNDDDDDFEDDNEEERMEGRPDRQGSVHAEPSVHQQDVVGEDPSQEDVEEDYDIGEDDSQEDDDYFYSVPTNNFGGRHVNPFSNQAQGPTAPTTGGNGSPVSGQH